MPAFRAVFLALLVLGGCSDDEVTRHLPGEDFGDSTSVRITSPANGETVSPTFEVVYEYGEAVETVWLEGEDGALDKPVDPAVGTLTATLEQEGRQALTLVGGDAGGSELSRYEITVRVVEEGDSWVTLTSPPDGATVENPVSFSVEGSSDVDTVELLADEWSLGTVTPGEVLTYEFSGTGYERTIEALGYAGDEHVATDSIAITVAEGTTPEDSEFNDLVVDLLEGYPTDGTHDYYWPSSGSWAGTTQDIWYLGTLVAEGDSQGRCYCVGITWEVYMQAFEEADAMTGGDGTLNGMSVGDLYDFQSEWYVVDYWGGGAEWALDLWGLGEPVTDVADLQRGDFVQLWRYTGSGHSVIFDDWVLDGSGNVTGIRYWSCQSGTDGIGYAEEYFGSGGSDMDPAYFYAARGWMPENWIPWY